MIDYYMSGVNQDFTVQRGQIMWLQYAYVWNQVYLFDWSQFHRAKLRVLRRGCRSVRSINIDQTLRSNIALYELSRWHIRDATIVSDVYDNARYNNALLETATFITSGCDRFTREEANELSQSYRRIGSGEKRGVFCELSRGRGRGAVFITPGHRATTGAPS